MAPVKIKYVVSFTSQDPKYPVENLLLEEDCRPWLCSSHDRSRQLKAELQLEQASHIGYIDVGNCGSALLQIDVGRSFWPLDQQYLTLLPAATLMTPADAKLDKNRSGVRMFKEGDFLTSALNEKWDRVRLICSQPFNKHAQFGLTFLQIRTPLDVERAKAEPLSAPSEDSPALSRSPWLSHPAICRTFFPNVMSCTEEEMALKSQLQQLEPSTASTSCSPGERSPTCISRPAMMVLKAASVRKKTLPPVTGSSFPTAERKEEGEACVMESKQEFCKRKDQEKTSRRKRLYDNMKRSAPASVRSRNISQNQGRAKCRKRKRGNLGGDQEEEEEKVMGKEEEDCPEGRRSRLGTCPICAGLFPATLIAAHASSCGEEDCEAGPSSSALLWEESVEEWVNCPLCQAPFPSSEVEAHASSCGEPAELSQSSPSWLWVE